MIIYNVTVNIDKEIHLEWLQWMKQKHIPDVMATGYFLDNKVLRVLTEEGDGVNYAIQYTTANMNDLNEYLERHAPALQAEHTERYKDRFVAFRTLLEHV